MTSSSLLKGRLSSCPKAQTGAEGCKEGATPEPLTVLKLWSRVTKSCLFWSNLYKHFSFTALVMHQKWSSDDLHCGNRHTVLNLSAERQKRLCSSISGNSSISSWLHQHESQRNTHQTARVVHVYLLLWVKYVWDILRTKTAGQTRANQRQKRQSCNLNLGYTFW